MKSSSLRAPGFFSRATRPIRAFFRAAVFFLKVFPMLPSRPIDWVTPTPRIDKVTYPTCAGQAQGEVYRPPGPGPHPALVVCLGVVPFGVDHPQVPVLGRALARAGFAALLYWSPAMRDFRLVPEDIDNIALAYRWLTEQPYIDASRSGLLGTCVGGSFALMAAASPLIQDRVAMVSAYAPFSSMATFAADISSASRSLEIDPLQNREPWNVDQLARRVFVHSITDLLEPAEAERFRAEYANLVFAEVSQHFDPSDLSPDGRAVFDLLSAPDHAAAQAALRRLPAAMQQRLTALTPLNYLPGIHAPLAVLLHDRGDQVIPIGESRRLIAAFAGRPGVHYTEMNFAHLDPVKGKLPLFTLLREFAKFFRALHPVFLAAVR